MAIVLTWLAISALLGGALLMFCDAEHSIRSLVFFFIIALGLICGFGHKALVRELKGSK